jgi:hypothetical protein
VLTRALHNYYRSLRTVITTAWGFEGAPRGSGNLHSLPSSAAAFTPEKAKAIGPGRRPVRCGDWRRGKQLWISARENIDEIQTDGL